jgi:glycosyltransferase involved in cell wall biosynthesis
VSNGVRTNAIIGMGRLTAEKNFSDLIRIFSKLHQKYPNWKLCIYGEGMERNSLENLAANLGIVEYVSLPGITDDIDTVFLKNAIFVVSSLYEGFSIVLVEAMANGIACVSYDCPYGPGTIITHGKDGYLVENQNTQVMYNYLCHLVENPDTREKFGIAAKESAKRFDINNIGSRWLSLLSSNL